MQPEAKLSQLVVLTSFFTLALQGDGHRHTLPGRQRPSGGRHDGYIWSNRQCHQGRANEAGNCLVLWAAVRAVACLCCCCITPTVPAPDQFDRVHIWLHLCDSDPRPFTVQSTFSGNNVTVNGAFGGAIFHDFCDKDARAGTDRSFFTNNTFVDNQSQGFGGAIRIGSFQVRLRSVALHMAGWGLALLCCGCAL